MGAAADRQVAEIEATKQTIESDLRELEERLPAPVRSLKSLAGLILGSTALTLLVLERLGGKRSRSRPAAQEVIVRIVREDR